jgi:hypothetical protein
MSNVHEGTAWARNARVIALTTVDFVCLYDVSFKVDFCVCGGFSMSMGC